MNTNYFFRSQQRTRLNSFRVPREAKDFPIVGRPFNRPFISTFKVYKRTTSIFALRGALSASSFVNLLYFSCKLNALVITLKKKKKQSKTNLRLLIFRGQEKKNVSKKYSSHEKKNFSVNES